MTNLKTGRRGREKSISEKFQIPSKMKTKEKGRSMCDSMREHLDDGFGNKRMTKTPSDKTALERKEEEKPLFQESTPSRYHS